MNTKPDYVTEVFLQPGEFYFGDENTRIRTMLGSCVSITMWHPALRIGGMCHYMLPSRGGRARGAAALDGRYADEAIDLFLREIALTKSHPAEYEVKLFGGGNMFAHRVNWGKSRQGTARAGGEGASIAHKNIEVGRFLMDEKGFMIKAEHVGGDGRRHIIFDIWSGHVWVRHSKATTSALAES